MIDITIADKVEAFLKMHPDVRQVKTIRDGRRINHVVLVPADGTRTNIGDFYFADQIEVRGHCYVIPQAATRSLGVLGESGDLVRIMPCDPAGYDMSIGSQTMFKAYQVPQATYMSLASQDKTA
jgi:hypothetical protein